MRYMKTLAALSAAFVLVSLSAASARQAAVATPEADQEKASAEPSTELVPDQETRRLPVPDDASVTQARELIRQAYVDELAQVADNPEPFIRKLLEAVGRTEDPARKYAMLLEAEEAAVDGRDHARAMELVDLRASEFEVDAISRRLQLLAELLTPKAKPQDDVLHAIYIHATETVERSLADDRLDQGKEAADLAKSVGYKLFLSGKAKKDNSLIKDGESKQAEAKRLAKFIQERLALRDAYQQALQKLKAKPNDPTANGIVGQYICFIRGNWEDGLPSLSSSTAGDLQLVAKEELALGDSPNAKKIIDVAERWWNVAEMESTPEAYRREIRNHSAKLYKSVVGTLDDPLDRQLAEKRAAEFSGPPQPSENTEEVWASKDATYRVSSTPDKAFPTLLTGEGPLYYNSFAFYTRSDKPGQFIVIDLGKPVTVSKIWIENHREEKSRSHAGHIEVWLSKTPDTKGKMVWKATSVAKDWTIRVPPVSARYVTISQPPNVALELALAQVRIYAVVGSTP